MQIPIVIETLPGNRFRAKSTTALPLMVEGNSVEESLRLWQDTFSSVLPVDAEVVAVEPPVPPTPLVLQPPLDLIQDTLRRDRHWGDAKLVLEESVVGRKPVRFVSRLGPNGARLDSPGRSPG